MSGYVSVFEHYLWGEILQDFGTKLEFPYIDYKLLVRNEFHNRKNVKNTRFYNIASLV